MVWYECIGPSGGRLTMADAYWMFTASIVYFVCYVPELYANYQNQNANIYNVPEKVLMAVATGCALVYAVRTGDVPLITNYAPLLGLDVVALGMRCYYAWWTHRGVVVQPMDTGSMAPVVPRDIEMGGTLEGTHPSLAVTNPESESHPSLAVTNPESER